ncbi:hypothetical protein ACXR6G_18175 [Ancylomarina sp. YFZ004]
MESIQAKRRYTNAEIQKRIAAVAEKLPNEKLELFLTREYSYEIFRVRLPLFIRIEMNADNEAKKSIKKDHKNNDRWTWKYKFDRAGYSYAITNDWYPRHDEFVKKWLQENE